MYLSDSWTDSVDKLGGKAIGLNKLLAIANDTFQVPPFTVPTAESFLLHISGRGLQFNHTHDFSNEQIGQILDHILYGDIPADIVSEVEQWFEKAKKKTFYVCAHPVLAKMEKLPAVQVCITPFSISVRAGIFGDVSGIYGGFLY